MAKVDDWFWTFIDRYTQRNPRADWPDQDSEFWVGWKLSFIRHGVIRDIADDASFMVAEQPPAFPGEHLEALLVAIRKIWASSEVLVQPDSREAAERQSKDCIDCH